MRKHLLLLLTILSGIGGLQRIYAEEEIYAVLSSDSKTMTLYYDELREARNGATAWNSYGSTVDSVVLDKSMQAARPTKTQTWFWRFSKLHTITHLDYLNTSAVTNMYAMFSGCNVLKAIDVTHFNTEKVTTMSSMFSGCYALESININSFDISNVASLNSMFKDCVNLKTIYCDGDWSGSTAASSSANMFEGCSSLVGEKGTYYDVYNEKDATYAHPDGGVSNPGYFTSVTKIYTEFVESTNTLTYYYDDKMSSRKGITEIYDPNSNHLRFTNYNEEIEIAVIDKSMKKAQLTSTRNMFFGGYINNALKKLTHIVGLSNLNTSHVTDMRYMFAMCMSLETIDLSEFNTANVTQMNGMFGECKLLTSLDLNSFNISKVQDMSRLCFNCISLATIYCDSDWYSINPQAVCEMMFSGCTQLECEKGTECDGTNNIGITYARPDDPENGKPGYFTKKTATTIDNVQKEEVQATKVIKNGQIHILVGDKTYDAHGVEVK